MKSRLSIGLLVVACLGLALVAAAFYIPIFRDPHIDKARKQVEAASGIHHIALVGGRGRYVVYSNEYGLPGVSVLDLHTGNVRKLNIPGYWSTRARISPDGKWVVGEGKKVSLRGSEPRIEALWFYNLETDKIEMTLRGTRTQEEVSDPYWKPDGSSIVYVRAWQKSNEWFHSINEFTLSTQKDRVLLDGKVKGPPGQKRSPAWSPNSKYIAYFKYPNVWLYDPIRKTDRQISRLPAETVNAPMSVLPDPVAWSPDSQSVLYAVRRPSDKCYRLLKSSVGGQQSAIFPDECAIHPRWDPSGKKILYMRLGSSTRTPMLRSVGGSPKLVGLDGGIVYTTGYSDKGQIILSGHDRGSPRAIWQVDPKQLGSPKVIASSFEKPLNRTLQSQPESFEVISKGDVRIPVQVFPSTCREKSEKSPMLIWIPSEGDDIAPTWRQEIQLLNLQGIHVAAVNYRGSPGQGRAFREMGTDNRGKVVDVMKAMDLVLKREDVDPKQAVLLHVSSASPIGYRVTRRRHKQVAGLVDFVGDPRVGEHLTKILRYLPEMLWVSGSTDRITDLRTFYVERLRRFGLTVGYTTFFGRHFILDANERARIWEEIGEFVLNVTDKKRCDAQNFWQWVREDK